ncbi:methyl-accepting chemotaxis sensory transducer with Cache sensor [Halanaerobium saccharolyticum]|uniref:Methyl-accepting chemotaxis sensory transducer with Cache sensor n=1 Tax=Halanaerobium saccharolyticum TaxID=43595 RepID=A0A4R6LAT9_9FIRM|nr:methyl-accepting chemotaxis protein [Halanaerobium saccharolyticum]TDO73037.1 methyl-accepting chemotaxis sensory transducer with Cache sensor [Halanaerobium saccharolyticum]
MQKIRVGIKGKMISFIVFLVILTVLSLGFYSLNNLNNTLYQEKKEQVKEMVNSALGVIEYYYQQQIADNLSRNEAQKRAAAVLEKMTFGPGDQDYFWINDQQPVMIMHPYSKSLEGENIASIQDSNGKYLFKEMVEVVKEEGAGFVEYQWQYYDQKGRVEPKLSYVKGFEPWGWIIGTGVYINNIRSSYLELRNQFLIIGAIILLISLVLTYLIANYLARPITLLTSIINKLSDFDLRDDNSKALNKYSLRKDEIGSIAEALKVMKTNLLESVTKEANIADNLAASSQELSASSEEMSASADEVSNSIKKLAQGTVKQNDMLDQTEKNMSELDHKIDSITEKAEVIKSEAETAGIEIDKGSKAVKTTADQIEVVVDNQQFVLKSVTELDQLSGQIGKIVEIINGIADQTNLLALNAAIEAARAGEAGRGFSVVAEEIRELAEESSTATDDINSLIKEIQKKVSHTTEMMDQSEQGVKASSQAVSRAEKTFVEIKKVVFRLSDLINEIADNSQEMKLKGKDVNQAVENISEISHESASIAEEVAAASDEQSHSTIDIVKAAEDLAEMAQNLTVITSKYKS